MRMGASFEPDIGASTAEAPTTSAHGAPHSSTWQSPVPYLFGGLAAMLALIAALALLILACSYWKFSSYLDFGASASAAEPCDREKPASKSAAAREERFLVIMAGDRAPTFVAVPIAFRAAFLTVDSSDARYVRRGVTGISTIRPRARSGV